MKQYDQPRQKMTPERTSSVPEATPPDKKKRKRGPASSSEELAASPPTDEGSQGPDDQVSVTIRPLNIRRTTIKIVGTTSLVMHAWSNKAIAMIEAKQQKKVTGPKQAKDPAAEFEGSRYKIDDEHDGIPAVALKSCAVEAGMALGLKKTDLRKSFFVCPDGEELVPIICPAGPQMRRDMVRVGMGVADVRYRPEYKGWSCEVPVEFNAELISAEALVNLFDNAGYSVGIGEWRPQKDGTHGRFRVAAEG